MPVTIHRQKLHNDAGMALFPAYPFVCVVSAVGSIEPRSPDGAPSSVDTSGAVADGGGRGDMLVLLPGSASHAQLPSTGSKSYPTSRCCREVCALNPQPYSALLFASQRVAGAVVKGQVANLIGSPLRVDDRLRSPVRCQLIGDGQEDLRHRVETPEDTHQKSRT
jgi:hypothetical protein